VPWNFNLQAAIGDPDKILIKTSILNLHASDASIEQLGEIFYRNSNQISYGILGGSKRSLIKNFLTNTVLNAELFCYGGIGKRNHSASTMFTGLLRHSTSV
jgi:hypothetical protein